jgi:hypothetical protein
MFIILDANIALDKACEYFKLHKSKELLKFWAKLNVHIMPTTSPTSPNSIISLFDSIKAPIEQGHLTSNEMCRESHVQPIVINEWNSCFQKNVIVFHSNKNCSKKILHCSFCILLHISKFDCRLQQQFFIRYELQAQVTIALFMHHSSQRVIAQVHKQLDYLKLHKQTTKNPNRIRFTHMLASNVSPNERKQNDQRWHGCTCSRHNKWKR